MLNDLEGTGYTTRQERRELGTQFSLVTFNILIIQKPLIVRDQSISCYCLPFMYDCQETEGLCGLSSPQPFESHESS